MWLSDSFHVVSVRLTQTATKTASLLMSHNQERDYLLRHLPLPTTHTYRPLYTQPQLTETHTTARDQRGTQRENTKLGLQQQSVYQNFRRKEKREETMWQFLLLLGTSLLVTGEILQMICSHCFLNENVLQFKPI